MNDLRPGRGARVAWLRVVAALALASGAATAAATGQATPADADRQGHDLARRVARAQDTVGFTARARVVVGTESDGGPRPLVLQIRLLGRRDAGGMRLLFQVFWPSALKGHAAVVDRRPRQPLTGFLFDVPDRVTPLTHALLTASFAGTSLSLEDLADNASLWPTQRFAGTGRADGQPCAVLESQPARAEDSAYTMVRSCIDTKRAVPRWIEKFGPPRTLVKRIVFERRRARGRNDTISLTMIVTDATGAETTRVEFLRSERDIIVGPAEFAPERLRHLGAKSPRDASQDN